MDTIHEVLLRHLSYGSGAAGYLRGKIPGFTSHLKTFFASRSDIHRIQLAEELAEKILEMTDFSDLIPLRSAVATLEIGRRISYRKQTDHTAHTVYLFLLGIWAYDHLTELRASINESIASSKPIHMFVFQWIYASLLHDTGYIFFEYAREENSSAVQTFDRLFSLDNIIRFTGSLSETGRKELHNIWIDFTTVYEAKPLANVHEAKQLIVALDDIPWLPDLNQGTTSGMEILCLPAIGGQMLQEFALNLAERGYNGIPIVDHGVASGLMLLKYSSLWYWIFKHAAEQCPNLLTEMSTSFHYPIEVFNKHVIPACRAAACHNMSGFIFQTQHDPLLYLAVLCDELQIWDRFLSGEAHIENWRTVEHCMAENVYAELINEGDSTTRMHLLVSNTQYEKITSTLDRRLKDWRNFAQISIYN